MASRISAKSNKNELRRRANALHDEVEGTASGVATHARKMADELRNGVTSASHEAGRLAQESYELARNTAGSYAEQGRQRAMELERSVERYVVERPIRSLAIAAGVGFVAALFLTRRS